VGSELFLVWDSKFLGGAMLCGVEMGNGWEVVRDRGVGC